VAKRKCCSYIFMHKYRSKPLCVCICVYVSTSYKYDDSLRIVITQNGSLQFPTWRIINAIPHLKLSKHQQSTSKNNHNNSNSNNNHQLAASSWANGLYTCSIPSKKFTLPKNMRAFPGGRVQESSICYLKPTHIFRELQEAPRAIGNFQNCI